MATVKAAKANIDGRNTGGSTKATIVEIKPSGSARAGGRRAYTSPLALESAISVARQMGGVDRYTPVCDPATAYSNLMRVYEGWQFSHIKGDVVPEDLRTELTAAGLVARHLYRNALLISDNKPVNERIGGQKPCDALTAHVGAVIRMLGDDGECGLDMAEKRNVTHPDLISFVSRMMLRNCCCEVMVADLGTVVDRVLSDEGAGLGYIQLTREDVRSDGLPTPKELRLMRGPRG